MNKKEFEELLNENSGLIFPHLFGMMFSENFTAAVMENRLGSYLRKNHSDQFKTLFKNQDRIIKYLEAQK